MFDVQLSVIALWLVLIKAVKLAVFPFYSKFITNGHHKDLNMRLTMEMIRLVKGVSKILQNYMQLDPELVSKSLQNSSRSVGAAHEDNRQRIADLKKVSIAYSEYKEQCHLIQKLCETSDLFIEVN